MRGLVLHCFQWHREPGMIRAARQKFVERSPSPRPNTHEPVASQPTPGPSQEGNNPPCAAPRLGGAGRGFRGSIRGKSTVGSLPQGEGRGEGERHHHLFVPAQTCFITKPIADREFVLRAFASLRLCVNCRMRVHVQRADAGGFALRASCNSRSSSRFSLRNAGCAASAASNARAASTR